jgi:hypothetical protein
MSKFLVNLIEKKRKYLVCCDCCLDKTKNENFILMEKRLSELYKKPDAYQVLET